MFEEFFKREEGKLLYRLDWGGIVTLKLHVSVCIVVVSQMGRPGKYAVPMVEGWWTGVALLDRMFSRPSIRSLKIEIY